MSEQGFNEELIVKALSLFVRDIEKFKEEDLQSPTFKAFI